MGTPGTLLRRRWLLWAVLGATVVIAFVLSFFEPQALFLDETVSEAAPGATAARGDEGAKSAKSASRRRAQILARGAFRPLAHDVRGRALLVEAGGETYLRFEGFEVENGPDLRVYLSRAPADASEDELAARFVDLGELKGNVGDQNYLVPASVEVAAYRSAVVWCRRFSVGFAVAPVDVDAS